MTQRGKGKGTEPPKAGGRPDKPEAEESMETETRENERKERVLHTRVPAVLERELKRFADNLRVPVSNLVRTILEDAMDVADLAGDRVEERLRHAATTLEKERERLRRRVQPDPLTAVFAYQEVTLAQGTVCAKCGEPIPAGTRAHLGLADAQPGSRVAPKIFVCGKCLPHDMTTQSQQGEES